MSAPPVVSPVVVTGGASGIGLACARALAAAGRPVAIWDLQAQSAEQHALQIGIEHGVAVIGIGVDVTDSDAIAAAVSRSRQALGPIGGLVHAAGVVRVDPVGSLDNASWDAVLDVNLRAFALLAQALAPDLTGQSGSAIVGISSIEGIIGNASIPAYVASKTGMLGLVRSLAQHFGPFDVRVNAICPGFIETPMLAGALELDGVRAAFETQSVLGRIGRPSEIAAAARFLLSEDASFITGTHLIVDGGVTAVR